MLLISCDSFIASFADMPTPGILKMDEGVFFGSEAGVWDTNNQTSFNISALQQRAR